MTSPQQELGFTLPSRAAAAVRRSPAPTRHGSELDIEPLDATFRDSNAAPLHSWFPYLEGYSPRFVRRVRAAYLPDAERVLEPFAGSGTTPIVLAQDGIECAYTEANPAMSFVSRVKLMVMSPTTDRHALAEQLRELATGLGERVGTTPADTELLASYDRAFGKSRFFGDHTLHEVARLRSLGDELQEAGQATVADCFGVAVMSALLPCSLLKRAGDVRYKTPKELAIGVPDLLPSVRERLLLMAVDVASAQPLRASAYSLGTDARNIAQSDRDAPFDGVITSPPYLNGTNYIRNAKLELWYLRELAAKADLRTLRDAVVTSGINDVDSNTRFEPVSDGVASVVERLRSDAYDERIAKMVGGYFFDMRAVFESMRRLVKAGGTVCVDIGDSVYAGVHVPTDELLAGIGEDLGFRRVDTVYLRKRRSKGGDELRQTLLVFKAPGPRTVTMPSQDGDADPSVVERWSSFKDHMPHQEAPYSKRNWGSPMHSLCSYQGKLKPSLAFHLVETFSRTGDLVVDPFSGAGTVPFEACRTGREGFGIDISGLGYVLTRAKVRVPDRGAIDDVIANLGRLLEDGSPTEAEQLSAAAVSFNSAIPDYFHPATLREVLLARRFFKDLWGSSDEWAFVYACCLHILHGNRPYALSRRSHPITPFAPTGEAEYRPLIPRLREKVERALADWEPGFAPGGAAMSDCAAPWRLPRAADAVITSPPFFDSTRFYMTNWMRYWFTGWEREDFDKSVQGFFETRQRRNLDVYQDFFREAAVAMRPGAFMVMHLGLSKKCDMAEELGRRVPDAFEHIDSFYEGVEHCESHGVRDKGTVNGHSYLVLRRR